MPHISQCPRSAARGEEGASATEYGLVFMLVAVIVYFGIAAFGDSLGGAYQWMATQIDSALEVASVLVDEIGN